MKNLSSSQIKTVDLAKFNLIEGQLRPNKVFDPLLIEAIQKVDRSLFLPPAYHDMTYSDYIIPYKENRFFTPPLALSRLLQLSHIKQAEKVLVVGCLIGYSVALLSFMAKKVVGVDSEKDALEKGKTILSSLDIENGYLEYYSSYDVYPSVGDFDVVLIEGIVADTPTDWILSLKEEARLVALIQKKNGLGRATLFYKNNASFQQTSYEEMSAGLLPFVSSEKKFSF